MVPGDLRIRGPISHSRVYDGNRPEIRGFERANERNIARTHALFVQPEQDLALPSFSVEAAWESLDEESYNPRAGANVVPALLASMRPGLASGLDRLGIWSPNPCAAVG